jgi:hypothetical protein
MTVSGVHTFTLNRDELIREALELTGTIDIGSPIPSEVLASCARTLNLYSKSWQAKGLFIHTYQPAVLPLTANTQSYLLGPGGAATETDLSTPITRPIKIDNVRLAIDSFEQPVAKISIEEYNALTNKDSAAQPTQYAYDPQLDNSRLYIWPVADNNSQKLYFTYQKPVDDFITDSDTATMPVDWLQCFTLGLAYHISPKRMVPLSEQAALKKRYEDALSDLDDFEETSVFFSPGTR